MPNSPLQPPVPFADFEFSFDPSLSTLFPNPPPLPPSADLFSPAETTDLFGFLEGFGDVNWEYNVNNDPVYNDYTQTGNHSNSLTPYSNPHLNTTPEPFTSHRPKSNQRSTSSRAQIHAQAQTVDASARSMDTQDDLTPTYVHDSSRPSASGGAPIRAKPLLSTPQKRLNHIMSEQKRRNAIRDGYAQLISLLAPAGSAPGIGMPTRGRPKGSGLRGKGQTKGKSGVLFRAVEYCRWLEGGRDALREEVLRLEAAAGIQHPS